MPTLSPFPSTVVESQERLSTVLQGVKVGFGERDGAHLSYGHHRDAKYVRSMKEAVGYEKMLMVDCEITVLRDVSAIFWRAQAFGNYGLLGF
jgi:L-alanine-DL-glutamate epimerase-like enolase superfamily enzyme